jgi:hypothetical protein
MNRAQQLIEQVMNGVDPLLLLEDAPAGVKTTKLNRKGFIFLIWENPKVGSDSDGQWQGSYQNVDGSWSETKPASKYGYESKKELLQHLDKIAVDMWKARLSDKSRAPYRQQ